MARLTRWEPFDPFSNLLAWPGFTRNSWSENGAGGNSVELAPPADVIEEEGAYLIDIDLPGVPKDSIEISVEKNVLTVKAERKYEHEETDEKTGAHRIERKYGAYRRSFQLPETVDAESVSAGYRDGVLNLRLPKQPAAQPRVIELQ